MKLWEYVKSADKYIAENQEALLKQGITLTKFNEHSVIVTYDENKEEQ